MENLRHPLRSMCSIHGCNIIPSMMAVTLMIKTLSDESESTTPINMVGGMHITIAPIVPIGILYGRGADGAMILNRTNVMNSSIIPKQYRKFSAATISSKLSHDEEHARSREKDPHHWGSVA